MDENTKNQQVKALLKKLSDKDPDARQEGLKEALNLPDIRVLESVKVLLNDSNPAVRYYAKKTFGSLSAQIASRTMVEAEEKKAADDEKEAAAQKTQGSDFLSREARDRIKNIQSIPDSADAVRAGLLIDELKTTGDKYIIATIIKKLGKIGGKDIVSNIIPYLSHEDPRVIANAIEALDELGDEEGVMATLKLLSHEDNRVKGNITKILYKYLEKDRASKSLILDKLSNMLDSKEPWTQDSAIYALSAIGNDRALEILTGFKGHAEGAIRNKISDTILKLKKKLDPNFEERERNAKWASESVINGIDSSIKTNQRLIKPQQVESINENIAKFKDLIWRPDAKPQQNAIRVAAASVIILTGLFMATVFFNVLYILAIGQGVKTSSLQTIQASDATGESRGEKAVIGLIAAEKFDEALSLVKSAKSGTVYNSAEMAMIDLIHSKKVESLVSKNQSDEALKTLAEWQNYNSSATLACILKGQLELKYLGKVSEARASFGVAAVLEPENFDARSGLADCSYYEKQYVESLRLYTEAAKFSRNAEQKHQALFGTANSKAAKGDYPGAEASYKECLDIKIDYFPSRLGLSKVYRLMKKYDRAKAEIEKVMAADSVLPIANFELAGILDETGASGEALKYYKAAADAEPASTIYRTAYINALFKLQVYQGLDDLIKAEIAAGNKNRDLYEKLGISQYALNHSIDAKDTFEKAKAAFGENDVTCYYLGLLNEEKESFDDAIDEYKKALNANPKHLPSYLNLSNIYLNIKRDYNQTEIITELGITNCGNHPGLLYNKALSFYFQKNPAQALIFLKAAMNSDNSFIANEAKKLETEIRSKMSGPQVTTDTPKKTAPVKQLPPKK
ncbi:MAG TPA: HEAT repeat domain-containing protein [Candidatus Wallbacteria bacterium]|nr:HEAT repeat domain-containing protein [Candidatus Wallbacteria bacterium]